MILKGVRAMAYTATAEIIPARPLMMASTPTFSEDLFDRFIDYTDRKETTVKGYISCIRQFARWMEQNGIETPTRADIKAYRDYLKEGDLAPGTQFQYLRAVKHFFKWTAAEGLYPNVADNIHGVKIRHDIHRKDAFTKEQAIEILNTIDRSTVEGKRNYCMLWLKFVDGLRGIELHRANIGDLKTIGGDRYLYIQGKGHDEKDEGKYITPELDEVLRDYLSCRVDSNNLKSPLFASTSNRNKNGRIAATTVSSIAKKIFVNAGYDSDRLTSHSTRHTAATAALAVGASLHEAQQLMGHCDPSTTERYLHINNKLEIEKKYRQRIYDYYISGKTFNPVLPELESAIMELTPEEQRKLLELVRERKF